MALIFTDILTSEIKNQIKSQALEYKDEETCGILVRVDKSLRYIPCKNNAVDKRHNFSIGSIDYLKAKRLGDIVAICHSQVERSDISNFDMQNCKGHNVPFVLYCKQDDAFSIITEPNTTKYFKYLGRTFCIGKQDCFTLVQDYYKNELGICIQNVFRQNLWHEEKPDLIIETATKEGFTLLLPATTKRINDILVYKVESHVYPMHLGVYVGADEFLHHPRLGGSRIDQIGNYGLELIYIARKE